MVQNERVINDQNVSIPVLGRKPVLSNMTATKPDYLTCRSIAGVVYEENCDISYQVEIVS